eukprot:COSAG01_NODE_1236_length_11101_cov_6.515179_7_plen_81_part_00
MAERTSDCIPVRPALRTHINNPFFQFFVPTNVGCWILTKAKHVALVLTHPSLCFLSRPMQGSHSRHAKPTPGWVLGSGGP